MLATPVYVFGGSGFIGGALVRRLESRGLSVVAPGSGACDLGDEVQIAAALHGMPAGARVAFCATVNKGVDDSAAGLAANLRMADNLARALRARRPGGVVFLGSVDVYGKTPPVPLDEGSPTAPDGYYGISKLASEHLLRQAGGPGCPLAVLRLPGVYGPGDRGRSVMARMARGIREHGRVRLEGGGAALRDYLYVEDLLDLMERLLLEPRDCTLNVATGRSLPVREIVRLLALALDRTVVCEQAPANPAAAGDLVFDTAALQRLYPGVVATGMEQGAALVAGRLAEEEA